MSSKRTATARAAQPCYLYVLTRHDLHSMMSLYPNLARRVEMMIRIRIDQMRSKTMQMTAEHTGDIEQFYSHPVPTRGGDDQSASDSPTEGGEVVASRGGETASSLTPSHLAAGITPSGVSRVSEGLAASTGDDSSVQRDGPPSMLLSPSRAGPPVGRYAEMTEHARRIRLQKRAKKHGV